VHMWKGILILRTLYRKTISPSSSLRWTLTRSFAVLTAFHGGP